MPNYYNPYSYQQGYMPQPQMTQMSQNQMPVQQAQQIQNGGFVSVRNEIEARNYPVAFGNSITFKDENAPYIYTKTMGFSQLDNPVFDKYRLVKEEPTMPQNETEKAEADKLSYDELKGEIEAVKGQIEALKEKVNAMPKQKSKKEMIEDDAE